MFGVRFPAQFTPAQASEAARRSSRGHAMASTAVNPLTFLEKYVEGAPWTRHETRSLANPKIQILQLACPPSH